MNESQKDYFEEYYSRFGNGGSQSEKQLFFSKVGLSYIPLKVFKTWLRDRDKDRGKVSKGTVPKKETSVFILPQQNTFSRYYEHLNIFGCEPCNGESENGVINCKKCKHISYHTSCVRNHDGFKFNVHGEMITCLNCRRST